MGSNRRRIFFSLDLGRGVPRFELVVCKRRISVQCGVNEMM